MWPWLIILALWALLGFWRGPTAVWALAAFGAIVGLIGAIAGSRGQDEYDLSLVWKISVLGSLLGAAIELCARLGQRKAD